MRMPRLLVHDEFYEQMYLYKLFRHRQDSYLILSVKDSRGDLTRKGAKSVSSPPAPRFQLSCPSLALISRGTNGGNNCPTTGIHMLSKRRTSPTKLGAKVVSQCQKPN